MLFPRLKAHRDAGRIARRSQAPQATPPSHAAVHSRLRHSTLIRNGHDVIPIVDPTTQCMPFAVALETCTATAPVPISARSTRPMCDLVYFLHGRGTVQLQQAGSAVAVAAGDSILAPAGTVLVGPSEEAAGAALPSFLHVILPLDYVLESSTDALFLQQCRVAAAEATASWHAHPRIPVSMETLMPVLAAARRQLAQPTHTIRKHPGFHTQSSTATSLQHNPLLALSGGAHRLLSALSGQLSQLAGLGAGQEGTVAGEGAGVLPSVRRGAAAAMSALRCMSATRHIPLTDASFFQLPNQDNQLALVLDPAHDEVPFTFGVEVFPPGFSTPTHVHEHAHEMFFILAGHGEAFCDGERLPLHPGDAVVFPPGVWHAIDANAGCKLYCLELMLPDEMFADFVRQGSKQNIVGADDMCVLTAVGCGTRRHW